MDDAFDAMDVNDDLFATRTEYTDYMPTMLAGPP
jgi:hypothetical protein